MYNKIQPNKINKIDASKMTFGCGQQAKLEMPNDSFERKNKVNNVERIAGVLVNYDLRRMAKGLANDSLYGFSLGSISLATLKNSTPSINANILNIDTGYEDTLYLSPKEFIEAISIVRDSQTKDYPKKSEEINNAYHKILEIVQKDYNVKLK